MSEPQLPQREGTQTNGGRSGAMFSEASATPGGGEAAGVVSFGSLAAAGARLVQLREGRGWSTEDVSARLKVPTAKLRALEAGDVSGFPGTTFALGVVRSYAKMLGVHPAPFVQALRREAGEPEPDLSMPASTGTDMPRGRVSVPLGSTPRHRSWWWGVAAVVVVLVALVMWRNGGEPPAWFARLKATAHGVAADSSSAATANVQGQMGASGTTIVASNAASEGGASALTGSVDAASNAQEPSVNAAPPSTEESAPQSPATVASTASPSPQQQTAAASAAQPAPTVTSRAASAAQPQPSAEMSPPAMAASAASVESASQPAMAAGASDGTAAPGTSTLGIAVTQDSWFSVRDKSGKEVFSGVVHAGEVKQVAGERPFKVVAGNRAGVQSITLDGTAVDAAKYATGKGNVSRFSLP